MVAHAREDFDVGLGKRLFNHVGDLEGVADNLFFGVVPCVMRRVISCPEEEVRLDVCCDVV